MSSTAIQARREPSISWGVAIIAALLTHVVILGAVELLGVFDPPPATASREPIAIVFTEPAAPAEEPADRTEQPTQFSELPEDRADLPPDDPDFLSNVDSRARDRAVAEAETDMPRMEGESDAPHVALDEPSGGVPAEEAVGEDGLREQPSVTEAGGDEALVDQEVGQPATRSREGAALSEVLRDFERGRTGDPGEAQPEESGRPGTGREDTIRAHRADEVRYSLRANGNAYFQEEMNNPGGNVSLFGDISLNTLNWEFAPWIQWFVRQFHRNWDAPYAYRLGIISGYELVDLEVAPDGRLLLLEVVEQTGHESLTESTLITFRAFTPYRPLPDNFPEPTLKLRVRVNYPDWR